MTCQDVVRAVDAYLDDELSVMDILRVHGHIFLCEGCRRVVESETTLHGLLAADAIQDEPPPALRERILDQVAAAAPRPSRAPAAGPRVALLPAVLAGLALVVLLALFLLVPRSSERAPAFAEEIAAKHRFYSQGALGMATADTARLTDWLERGLGFPVKAPQLARPDERLLGGRLSSVVDVPAAYLLYERDRWRTSLFIAPRGRLLPSGGARRVVEGVELSTATLGEITVVWWEDADRLYAAVSAAPATDLVEFALLCVRSERLSRLSPPPGRHRRPGSPLVDVSDVGT